jgi:hypothetical protein
LGPGVDRRQAAAAAPRVAHLKIRLAAGGSWQDPGFFTSSVATPLDPRKVTRMFKAWFAPGHLCVIAKRVSRCPVGARLEYRTRKSRSGIEYFRGTPTRNTGNSEQRGERFTSRELQSQPLPPISTSGPTATKGNPS